MSVGKRKRRGERKKERKKGVFGVKKIEGRKRVGGAPLEAQQVVNFSGSSATSLEVL